ncbi:MAG: DUF445 family protein [Clostridia bacterium]|nr:DUF445 family protein [Clostridia bacterium]
MNYMLMIRPMIGAVIGYVTNWIAVKMMFRPLHPIKVGNWTLPFTPGIIPKNKERISNSIGNVISENLLNEQVLLDNLLSDEIEAVITQRIIGGIDNLKRDEETIEKRITSVVDKTSYDITVAYLIDSLADKIYETIQESNVGATIAKQIESGVMEKLSGSILGMFGGNTFVSKISDSIEDKINEYIRKNGHEIVTNMVEEEMNKITNAKISDVMAKVEKSEIDLVSITMNIYKKIVMEKLSDILKMINIAKIVTDKINAMDMLELEKMILEIMKKELNALVNLGAVIGFVLGLLNLLI